MLSAGGAHPANLSDMAERSSVFVYAADPILEAGVAAQLAACPSLRVVGRADPDAAEVAVVVVDEVDEDAARVIRALQRPDGPRVVVVATRLDDAGLLAAVEAGACALLRRGEATATALEGAVRAAAAGDGSVPGDLLARLLDQVGRLKRQVLDPRGIAMSGLSEREASVLRLVAEGLETGEIARRLSYSERTIKNVIHDVTTRLGLRNRSHAVAFALREGLI
jgi:DNA-binding NarL/FixJ family response regulator